MNAIQLNDGRKRFFRAYLTVFQLLECLAQSHTGKEIRMLDVGGGHGIHARFFRSKGLEVDIVDMQEGDEPLTFKGDYMDYLPARPYDVIWSSHVLEHVPNVGNFLSKMYNELHIGGYLAVTVPPIREERMAFTHLSFWNCGMLLLNASLAGFDPRTARLASFGYNVSLIIQKTKTEQSLSLKYIRSSFPKNMYISDVHFSGKIKRHNFTMTKLKVFNIDKNFFEESYKCKNTIYYKDKNTLMRYKCV